MKQLMIMFTLLLCANGWCIEDLEAKYLITYGSSEAKIKVTQYFSFTCPHCSGIFKKDFKEIKAKYLDTKDVSWVFHPVPMDLLTIQAMECLAQLTDKEKRIFLEAILEEMDIDEPDLTPYFMQKSMEFFKKPIPKLQDKSYLTESTTFEDAFRFLKQEEKIKALPCVMINNKLFPTDVPSKEFMDLQLNPLLSKAQEKKI